MTTKPNLNSKSIPNLNAVLRRTDQTRDPSTCSLFVSCGKDVTSTRNVTCVFYLVPLVYTIGGFANTVEAIKRVLDSIAARRMGRAGGWVKKPEAKKRQTGTVIWFPRARQGVYLLSAIYKAHIIHPSIPQKSSVLPVESVSPIRIRSVICTQGIARTHLAAAAVCGAGECTSTLHSCCHSSTSRWQQSRSTAPPPYNPTV